MKRSKKFISMILAAVMATSCFGIMSLVSASAADEETKIYFEVPTLEAWGETKSVFCHVYSVWGDSDLKATSWQSKAESCRLDADTGLYYFDTSKLGTIKEGADYALLFSTKDTTGASHQTGNVTFGTDCLGDTVYVTGNMIENTEDSSKLDYEAAWKNNSDKYGSKAAITSTGAIVGNYFPINQPKEEIVAQYLNSWAVLNESLVTPEVVANLCTEFNVEPIDVYNTYAEMYAEQLADPEAYPSTASLEVIAKLLGVEATEPTTEATEPTTEATEPTTEATEPTTEATEPTTEATEPTTEATEPTTEATEPTTEATEPTTEATEPTTEATEPTTEALPIFGDLDGDGAVTIADATIAQKYSIGIDVAASVGEGVDVSVAGDVNMDGRVSVLDATLVQKYLANLGYSTGRVGQPIPGSM